MDEHCLLVGTYINLEVRTYTLHPIEYICRDIVVLYSSTKTQCHKLRDEYTLFTVDTLEFVNKNNQIDEGLQILNTGIL